MRLQLSTGSQQLIITDDVHWYRYYLSDIDYVSSNCVRLGYREYVPSVIQDLTFL